MSRLWAVFDPVVKAICIDSVMSREHVLSNSKEKEKGEQAEQRKGEGKKIF